MERSEADEPLLPAAQKNSQGTSSSTVKVLASSIALIAGHLTLGTVLFYSFQGAETGINLDECFYFAVTTFLTIGYGDIAPGTAAAKLFFIVYIFGSLAIQATVGGSLIASMVQVRQEQLPRDAGKQTDLYFRTRPKFVSLARAISFLLALMLGGAAMLTYSEDKSWIDSIYWACVTLTTVGFGDITPESHKAWFALYFLVGVIAFTYVFAESINIVLEVQLVLRLRKFFEQGVTEDMLARMDRFHDDREVNRDEFIIFMLQEMDIASDEQIERIIGIFDSLDVNGDGVLNTLDIRKRVAAQPTLASFSSMRVQNSTIRRSSKFVRSYSLGIGPDGAAARGRSLGVSPDNFADRAVSLGMIPEASRSDSTGRDSSSAFEDKDELF